MPGQNNEFDILTINGYPFNTKDTTARNDIASIIGAIQINNTSISGRINDLNERAFEDLIKISSNNETEISDIDDGMYKIQYVTVETIEEEKVETINNTALLIQKGTYQYLFKDGQLSSRTKTNNTWGEWKSQIYDSTNKLSGDFIEDGTINKIINVKPDWNAVSGNAAEILNKPTSLPANGGNADTVNGYTVYSNVPANAVFTDTNTWRPLGTGSTDACAGNDSRLSDSRPASDVYSWAKASTKPTYKASEVMSISRQLITANTSSSCSITGSSNDGKEETIIYVNNGSSDFTVTVPTTYITPDGAAIELTCSVGGYCEVSYINISGVIYARGI